MSGNKADAVAHDPQPFGVKLRVKAVLIDDRGTIDGLGRNRSNEQQSFLHGTRHFDFGRTRGRHHRKIHRVVSCPC